MTVYYSFNTSHVTVQLFFQTHPHNQLASFNTSHVTVQRISLSCPNRLYMFQYIPCYCSTCKCISYYKNCKRVSIHPMLLFNLLLDYIKTATSKVSIHPMLLFNLLLDYIKNSNIEVSIHPMLLFNL